MEIRAKVRLIVIVLLLLLLAVLVGKTVVTIYAMHFSGDPQGSSKEQNSPIRIGFSLGTLKEERWLRDRDIVMAKVQEMGGEIIVLNANNNDRDQLEQVRYLLQQNIDVLIIVPNDLHKAAAAVDLAKKQGVKVISYDRLVFNADVDLYISFDNEKVGEFMAGAVLQKVPRGNILIVNGATSDHNTEQIKAGYDRVLLDSINTGQIRIVDEQWSPNWMKEYAFSVTDQLLLKNVHIDAIICGNDSLAEGAIEALSQHRMAGQVFVVGQDADLAACQRVVEGIQLMTVYKPIEKLADAAARAAVQLARGEEPRPISREIYNGLHDVPFYVLEPIAVYKENMDSTIIKDRFHLADEVYINIP
jgi:D-xylose transport system substrate-binding protein